MKVHHFCLFTIIENCENSLSYRFCLICGSRCSTTLYTMRYCVQRGISYFNGCHTRRLFAEVVTEKLMGNCCRNPSIHRERHPVLCGNYYVTRKCLVGQRRSPSRITISSSMKKIEFMNCNYALSTNHLGNIKLFQKIMHLASNIFYLFILISFGGKLQIIFSVKWPLCLIS